MAERDALAVKTAELAGMGDSARVSFDFSGAGLMPVVWVDVGHFLSLELAGEFWMTVDLGPPVWVRFRRNLVAFNRAAFAPVELRLALDPADRPEGVWWPR